MYLMRAGLVGCAGADDGPDADERRALVGAGRLDGRLDGRHVFPVGHALDVPAVGLEASQHILRPGHGGGAVELDVVVVVERDEPAQSQVPGEAGRLRADALLQIAIGADGVGPVIDDVVVRLVELGGQAALGDGHAHGIGEALAQRSGRGLDAGGQTVLGVSRGLGAELAEALELLERQIVAGEVEHRVEQHGGVTRAEHEAVPIEPVGARGGVLEEGGPQRVGHRRGAHGRAGMATVGLLDPVDGKDADGVDGLLLVQVRGGAVQRFVLLEARGRSRIALERPVMGPGRRASAGVGWGVGVQAP